MKHPRAQAAQHPPWCHTARCNAFAEHRSEPLAVGAGPSNGTIVATRVQTTAGRDWIEIRVSAPLRAETEAGQARTARRVLDELVTALNRAIGGRR